MHLPALPNLSRFYPYFDRKNKGISDKSQSRDKILIARPGNAGKCMFSTLFPYFLWQLSIPTPLLKFIIFKLFLIYTFNLEIIVGFILYSYMLFYCKIVLHTWLEKQFSEMSCMLAMVPNVNITLKQHLCSNIVYIPLLLC